MEENQEQKAALNILKQEDISQIIKHFSFIIQQRFEEIQKNYNYFTCLNSINYDRSQIEKDILTKYNQYQTQDQHQIKLIEKFVQRLLQVFQFFRQKIQNPQILQPMKQKITQKFREILNNQKNYHFFINDRPKTQSINQKSLASRTTSNDFLSIVRPLCEKNGQKINSILENNKKSFTQIPQKRVIQVGKLFKYVFSILKRGYLVKLRMQRTQKKYRKINKENQQKTEQNTTMISVEGTCAILRDCSQKINKENYENYGSKMLSFCKEKLNINPLGIMNQNRKQYQITQKIKSRSISTNQYSFLSSQNPSILKQSGSKIRQIEKKINELYDILNLEKYSVLKIPKQPQLSRKEQLKRNILIQNERQKFFIEYQKTINKDKQKILQSKNKQLTTKKRNESLQFSLNAKIISSQGKEIQSFPKQKINTTQDLYIQEIVICKQNNIKEDEYSQIDCKKKGKKYMKQYPMQLNCHTEQNQIGNFQNDFNQQQKHSNNRTIQVCTSRPSSKLSHKVLKDKNSNLIANILVENTHQTNSKSKSSNLQQKKALRLNLPFMPANNSKFTDENQIKIQAQLQAHKNLSQKSQFYLQNYLTETNQEDNIFVPLLPKKENSNQNPLQNKNNFSILTKNNLIPNFHPLNRCRIFREKKIVRNSIMIPSMQHKNNQSDLASMNGRVKNALF